MYIVEPQHPSVWNPPGDCWERHLFFHHPSLFVIPRGRRPRRHEGSDVRSSYRFQIGKRVKFFPGRSFLSFGMTGLAIFYTRRYVYAYKSRQDERL